MLNIIDYIKNYCEVHNIENYAIRNNVLTIDDINKDFTFSPNLAFFYKFSATGIIENVTDLQKEFFRIETPTDNFDFAKLINVKDFNSVQTVESDFVFTVNNTMKLNYNLTNNIFKNLYNFQLYYITVSKHVSKQDSNCKCRNREVEVKIKNI